MVQKQGASDKMTEKSEFFCEPIGGGIKITCEGKSVTLSETDFLAAIKTWLGNSNPKDIEQKNKLLKIIK